MKTFDDYLEMAKKPTTNEMYILFTQINKDAQKSGASVVNLTDVNYYTHQIENIYGVDYDSAKLLAKSLAQYVKEKK